MTLFKGPVLNHRDQIQKEDTRTYVKWKEADPTETKFERIATQKWISMYPDGQEAWTEFRRTRYPKIFPVVVNNSGGLINSTTQVRRLPFPQTEYQSNSAGVATGIAVRQEQLGDSGHVRRQGHVVA